MGCGLRLDWARMAGFAIGAVRGRGVILAAFEEVHEAVDRLIDEAVDRGVCRQAVGRARWWRRRCSLHSWFWWP